MDKKYDFLYIVPAKYTDKEIPKINELIAKTIKDNGAQIIEEEILGRRKIAYPIKQSRYGYFVNQTIAAKPADLEKINKELRILPEILRFQITEFIPKSKTAPIETQTTEISPKEAQIDQEEILKPTKPITEAAELKPEISKKPKVALEDLDKKLDEILKEGIE